MPSLTITASWPPDDMTGEDFEKLGLTEEEAQQQADLADRLAAFHRLRSQGIFYQVYPKE